MSDIADCRAMELLCRQRAMSGSPLLADYHWNCMHSAGNDGSDHPHTEGGPNPRLIGNFPGWCIKSLKSK